LLEVVGDGDYLDRTKKIADKHVVFHSAISDFTALSAIYQRCHIFVMPSVKETFGLVYIEALSQGLPIIYCKGEGVDGFFEENEVGVSVKPDSVIEIVDSVQYIRSRYDQMSLNAVKASKKFNWNDSTKSFMEVYKEAVS
jgi:glycosyltransferase involved in cell wall biosynthesis